MSILKESEVGMTEVAQISEQGAAHVPKEYLGVGGTGNASLFRYPRHFAGEMQHFLDEEQLA